MDVYLSRAAYQGLFALTLDPSPPGMDGILLGHQRGPRILVENLSPSRDGFFSSPEDFFRLDRHFNHRIMGFYSLNPEGKKLRNILTPCICGKIFMEIRAPDPSRMLCTAYLVDYDAQGFGLKKLPLRRDRSRS